MSSEIDLIMAKLGDTRIRDSIEFEDLYYPTYRRYPSLTTKPLQSELITYVIEYFRLNPGFIPCEYTIGNQTVVA
jgi:hypothetical protein